MFKKLSVSRITKVTAGALSVLLLTAGCSNANDPSVVVTIDGGADTITLGYANFATKYQQSVYDMYYSYGYTDWTQERVPAEASEDGTDDANTSMENSIKDGVMTGFKTQYVSKQHAAEYGCELTAEETEKINQAAKKFISENSNDAKEYLSASEENVRRLLEDFTYVEKIANVLKAEAEVSVTDEEANMSTFSYALIDTAPIVDEETGEVTEYTTDEMEQKYADGIALSEAADFFKAAEDMGLEVKTYTYPSAALAAEDSTLGEIVIREANGLGEGKVSGPVTVDGTGVYVLHMDKKTDAEATASKKTELEEQQKNEYYTEIIDEWTSQIDWEVDETQWAKVTFTRNLVAKPAETAE